MDKQFDSLDTYIQLAKKTISKFAPKFYNGLAAEMLSNEDAISDNEYVHWERSSPSRPDGSTGYI